MNNAQSGFTLVETLVAISIFTVSVLTMIVVLSDGIANTNYAKKKVTSVYLAQEGIETMRNMRDTYMLFSLPANKWSDFITKINPCTNARGCYFNDWNLDYSDPMMPITNIPLVACGVNCPTLLYDSSTGKYNYNTGINSGFRRKVNITYNPTVDANSVEVEVTIFWTQGSGTYQLSVYNNLVNWTE